MLPICKRKLNNQIGILQAGVMPQNEFSLLLKNQLLYCNFHKLEI